MKIPKVLAVVPHFPRRWQISGHFYLITASARVHRVPKLQGRKIYLVPEILNIKLV